MTLSLSSLSFPAILQRRCVAAFGPPPFDGLRPPPYIAVDYFQLTNFTDVRSMPQGPRRGERGRALLKFGGSLVQSALSFFG